MDQFVQVFEPCVCVLVVEVAAHRKPDMTQNAIQNNNSFSLHDVVRAIDIRFAQYFLHKLLHARLDVVVLQSIIIVQRVVTRALVEAEAPRSSVTVTTIHVTRENIGVGTHRLRATLNHLVGSCCISKKHMHLQHPGDINKHEQTKQEAPVKTILVIDSGEEP